MEYKEVPEMPKYDEKPFNGRELVTKRLTPVKVGLIAFHTVNATHPDAEALEVTNNILK